MDEFIQMVTEQLGVSNETGKSATGGILKMLQDQLGSDLFAKGSGVPALACMTSFTYQDS